MRVDGTTGRRYGTRRRAGWWMLEIWYVVQTSEWKDN
ncbi:hypothetical protein C366_06655 [Cryptococcus neoformans Tu401-1]|nr:hypothetical protein C366_06655 [Cryptococcus neoformans var. grubii Tu401-1]